MERETGFEPATHSTRLRLPQGRLFSLGSYTIRALCPSKTVTLQQLRRPLPTPGVLCRHINLGLNLGPAGPGSQVARALPSGIHGPTDRKLVARPIRGSLHHDYRFYVVGSARNRFPHGSVGTSQRAMAESSCIELPDAHLDTPYPPLPLSLTPMRGPTGSMCRPDAFLAQDRQKLLAPWLTPVVLYR